MGVHGLWRLLDTFGEVTQPECWRGKRVAIDASIWMAQFRAQCPAGENVEQRILEGFLLRVLKLLFYGIHPVVVFDGATTSSKSMEYHRRMVRREAMERAALSRCAQRIITAQLAAGELDVKALERRSPPRRELHHPSVTQALDCNVEHRLSIAGVADAAAVPPPPHGNHQRAIQKRRRETALEPDAVSRTLTHVFLKDAEEWIDERRRCEKCIESNALTYSSTSLFMGPRRVLDEGIDALGASKLQHASVAKEEHPIIISSDDDSSVRIDDDDHNDVRKDNDDCGSTLSSARSESSVFIIDGRTDTLVSCLYNMEGVDDDSVDGGCCGSWLEGDEVLSDAGGSGDSVCLWNPGTQLPRQESAGVGVANHVASECGSESALPLPVSPLAVEEQVGDGCDATHTPEGPPRVSDKVGLVMGAAPLAWTPSMLRRVIPLDLLGIVELLDCCGIPFVLSPREADAQCAFLSQQRLVDAVFTEDSDVVVHGAAVVLRGFFAKGRHVVAYRQSDLLASGIDKDVLVSLAVLLGCDYAEGVNGLSLHEALYVIAAMWHQSESGGCSCCYSGGDGGGAAHVMDMLKTWRTAVVQTRGALDDAITPAQFLQHRDKWSTLQLAADFPQVRAVDAFFRPPVDLDMRPFSASSPDWKRLRSFASVHGLLESATCRQRLDLAQKEFLTRESRGENVIDRRQLTLMDFNVELQRNERHWCKKQQPRLAAALSAISAVRKMTCVAR